MARKPKADQTVMRGEGYERPKIPDIENAAEALRVVREERMELTEKENELAKALLETMRRLNVTTHTYVDDEGVERTAKREPGEEKVTVRKVKAKKSDEAPASN